MKKKLEVQFLEKGMYVSELDRSWIDTPFLFQGFEVRDDGDIQKLQQYCKYVYIDLEQGKDASAPHSPRPDVVDSGPSVVKRNDDSEKKIELELLKQAARPHAEKKQTYDDRTSVEEEVDRIRNTHNETHALIQNIMEDVRLGKSLNSDKAKQSVSKIANSVISNPDALTCFSQLKNKDVYTAEHSMRVCILALVLGRHLGFDETALNILGIGALLHDVGKMKIPGEVLNKPDELTDKEFDIMKKHVPLGVNILEQTKGIPVASIEVARCHHERYDGSGYMSGLSGDKISQFGQIGAIVDCYDAITSDRIYRFGMSPHAALKNMYEWRKSSFEPFLLEQFIQCMGIYPIGSLVELNTGEIAVVVTMNRRRRLKPKVVLVLKSNNLPYETPATIDLSTQTTRDGHPYEISTVLEPGTYGVNPVNFLPIHGVIS